MSGPGILPLDPRGGHVPQSRIPPGRREARAVGPAARGNRLTLSRARPVQGQDKRTRVRPPYGRKNRRMQERTFRESGRSDYAKRSGGF